MSAIPLSAKVTVPDDVLVQQIEGKSALLHMGSERYYGLDAVGTSAWQALVESDSIEAAIEDLLERYEGTREEVESDVLALVRDLSERKLLALVD